jgi:hypothetical protein
MVAHGEQAGSPERAVEVLGPEMPLLHRVELSDAHLDSPVMVGEKTSIYRTPEAQKVVSEAEVITDYYVFLARVQGAAENDKSPVGEAALSDARRFAEETVFMTKSEREEATRGIGEHFASFLKEDERNMVVFFVPANRKDHSQGFVSREVANSIESSPESKERVMVTSLEEGTESLDRLRVLDPDHVKIAVLDDWSVSGNHLANSVAHAAQSLQREELDRFKKDLEVGLLVARDDQVQDGFNGILRDVETTHGLEPLNLVTYFTAPARQHYHGPMPTGSHASVDYGFESRVQSMRDYLETVTLQPERLPWMASIIRQY